MSITVDRAELIRVRLPLQHMFRTSSHIKQELDHLLLQLTTRDGAIGWGECASPSDPYYGPESVDTCWPMLRDRFVPPLLTREWETPDDAVASGARIRGNQFARAAVDMACWDLWTRVNGTSLAVALGATQTCIEAGVSLGIEPTLDELLDEVARHLDEGYRRIKLKIAPGWDLAPVRAVRQRFGDIVLQVDANGVYQRSDTTLLQELDDFDLAMIEQPFEPADMVAHARLQAMLRTPICLDESIDAVATVDTALHLDAARIINVKVSRLGGLGPAKQVHDMCLAAGIPVWCGGMHEFGVGRAANVALAALPGFTLPSDVSGSDKYYLEDIVDPPIRATAGRVPVPHDRPGLGHDVIEDVVAKYTVAREVICGS